MDPLYGAELIRTRQYMTEVGYDAVKHVVKTRYRNLSKICDPSWLPGLHVMHNLIMGMVVSASPLGRTDTLQSYLAVLAGIEVLIEASGDKLPEPGELYPEGQV